MSKNIKHRDHLSSYLTKHRKNPQKNGGYAQTSKDGEKSDERMKVTKDSKAASYKATKRGKMTIHDIPGEIMMDIFSYLLPQDLILASQVCKKWHDLANDNALWRPIFKKYSGTRSNRSETRPKHRSIESMKQECMTRCVQQRNKRVFKHLRKRRSPYTGLQEAKEVEQALRTAGMTFELVMIDTDDREHTLGHQDVFYHTMSISIRWFSLEMPPLRSIKEVQLYSKNPLFYNHSTGKPVKDGPYQRSLLLTQEFKWTDMKGKATGGDEVISLYSLPQGLSVAVYKEGEEMAFMSWGLSLDNLVQQCMYGTNEETYSVSESKCLDSGISSRHGLLDYQLTVQLRSLRKEHWDDQFRHVDCKEGTFDEGYAVFTVVKPDQRVKINTEEFLFPWKTDIFKGKVKNVAILDVTLLDEGNNVFWTASSLVKIEKNKEISKMFDFDYQYDSIISVKYADSTGKISIQICKMDSGDTYLTNLTISLSLAAIDDRFGTKYKPLDQK